MKTYGRRIDDMVIRGPSGHEDGPRGKSKNHLSRQKPGSGHPDGHSGRHPGAAARGRRYGQDKDRAAADPDVDEPEYDAKCEALLPVLRGELPVHFHAHRLDDIFTAVRLAKEFHLRFAIVHGTEGHRAADILAAEGVRVLCGPLLCDRSKPELRGLTPRTRGFCTRRGWNSPS